MTFSCIDFGRRFDGAKGVFSALIEEAKAKIKGFPLKVSKRDEAQVREGIQLGYIERTKMMRFLRLNAGEVRRLRDNEAVKAGGDVIEVALDQAMLMTSAGIKTAAKGDPCRAAAIKAARHKVQQYTSDTYRDLLAAGTPESVKAIGGKKKPKKRNSGRTRSANKTWAAKATQVLGDLEKAAKAAKDPAQLPTSVDAIKIALEVCRKALGL